MIYQKSTFSFNSFNTVLQKKTKMKKTFKNGFIEVTAQKLKDVWLIIFNNYTYVFNKKNEYRKEIKLLIKNHHLILQK